MPLGKALKGFYCTAAYIYAMCDQSSRHCLNGMFVAIAAVEVAAAAVAVVVVVEVVIVMMVVVVVIVIVVVVVVE